MATFFLSTIFILGSLVAVWLLVAVLALGTLFVIVMWYPRGPVPLWTDAALCIGLFPLWASIMLWQIAGFSGEEKQERALRRVEFP